MKNGNERSIFLSFFDLKAQNIKVRSITKTVLEKLKKNFIELFRTSNIAKIDGPVTLLYELECSFFN